MREAKADPALGRPQLDGVTLCAADSAYVGLTAWALQRCLDQCDFADAVLFSDAEVEGPFRTVKIDRLDSVAAYSRFCLTGMPDHIATPFALVVQWDGFIVNPAAWARVFLKYDYIGAAWHGLFPEPMMVGNGGFSLRSRKLLKALKHVQPVGDYFEDRVICHIHRDRLEREFGVRFAPVRIADRFSYEFHLPEALPFGFHGVAHLWRHMDDDRLRVVAETVDLGKQFTDNLLKLALNCLDHGRPEGARAIYRRIRSRYPASRVQKVLDSWYGDDKAKEDLARAEGLL